MWYAWYCCVQVGYVYVVHVYICLYVYVVCVCLCVLHVYMSRDVPVYLQAFVQHVYACPCMWFVYAWMYLCLWYMCLCVYVVFPHPFERMPCSFFYLRLSTIAEWHTAIFIYVHASRMQAKWALWTWRHVFFKLWQFLDVVQGSFLESMLIFC